MATFDQLAADQRAIIELILRQDKSYEQIGEMLDLPPARVRELARDALAELAPFTAEFVDPQWRGQLADYVLGQQTGPESQATRGHLRRSEPARIWAYSLLDALDDFYADEARPEIPVGEAGVRGRTPEPAPEPNGEGPTSAVAAPARRTRAGGGRGGLSPAAQAALKRRRILAGVGIVAVVALLVFGGIEIFGGGSSSDKNKQTASSAVPSGASSSQSQQAGQIVAQAVLSPIGKSFSGQGAALVYQSGNQSVVVVRAKVPPSSGKNKYVLWLFNNDKQLTPLAADVTDKQGNFQGAAPLPANWTQYKFIDLTYQQTGKKTGHGTSVMRGPLTAPQQQSGSGQTGTGTGTTP
jgi:Anti-sigma-K factor rskA/Sigma-70, region 4